MFLYFGGYSDNQKNSFYQCKCMLVCWQGQFLNAQKVFINLKNIHRTWGDSSAVRSTCCYCWGSVFNSKYPQGVQIHPLIPVPGELFPISDPQRHTFGLHTWTQMYLYTWNKIKCLNNLLEGQLSEDLEVVGRHRGKLNKMSCSSALNILTLLLCLVSNPRLKKTSSVDSKYQPMSYYIIIQYSLLLRCWPLIDFNTRLSHHNLTKNTFMYYKWIFS